MGNLPQSGLVTGPRLTLPPEDGSLKAGSRGSAGSRRKTKRQTDRELDKAASHRKKVAANKYFSNPPKAEDIWMCEFCEYERIFGQPPRGLIRSYELKDRAVRAAEADRKRLLDKAKARTRKNRKSGKGPAKGSNTETQGDHVGAADNDKDHDTPPPALQGGGGDENLTHSEEEEEAEDYEGEYDEGITSRQANSSSRIEDEGGGSSSGGGTGSCSGNGR